MSFIVWNPERGLGHYPLMKYTSISVVKCASNGLNKDYKLPHVGSRQLLLPSKFALDLTKKLFFRTFGFMNYK